MLHHLSPLFLNTFYHFLLACTLGLFFFWRRRKKIAKALWIYAGLWAFMVSISPIPRLLVAARESQYPVLIDPLDKITDSTEVIVLVLGAGHGHTQGFTANDRLSDTALKRLAEGIRLHRLLPNSKLMCSGYSSSGRQTQAQALAETAILLGVNRQDTLLQGLPANTEEEAIAYAQRFGKNQALILVTSAIHMPRAMYWFEQQGLKPIPAPTHHLIQPDPDHEKFPFYPSIHKMMIMDKLLHEYVGMLYARWKN